MSKHLALFVTDRMFIKEVTMENVYDIDQLHLLPETDQFNTLGIPEFMSVTEDLVKKWIDKQNLDTQPSFVFCIQPKVAKQFVGLIGIKTN